MFSALIVMRYTVNKIQIHILCSHSACSFKGETDKTEIFTSGDMI